jgi:hypothetical protein
LYVCKLRPKHVHKIYSSSASAKTRRSNLPPVTISFNDSSDDDDDDDVVVLSGADEAVSVDDDEVLIIEESEAKPSVKLEEEVIKTDDLPQAAAATTSGETTSSAADLTGVQTSGPLLAEFSAQAISVADNDLTGRAVSNFSSTGETGTNSTTLTNEGIGSGGVGGQPDIEGQARSCPEPFDKDV